MIEKLLQELSTIAFIKIENRCTWFAMQPNTIKWIVESEHPTQRGTSFMHEGYDLEELLIKSIDDIKSVKIRCGGCDYVLPTHSNTCVYYKEP